MIVKGICTHCGMSVGPNQFRSHGGTHDAQRIQAEPEHAEQIAEDMKAGMVPAVDERVSMAPADHAEVTVKATVERAAEEKTIDAGPEPEIIVPPAEAPASSPAGE